MTDLSPKAHYSPNVASRVIGFLSHYMPLLAIMVFVFTSQRISAQSFPSNQVGLYGWLDQHSLDTANDFIGNEACVPSSTVNALTYLQNINPSLFGTNLTGGTNISSTQGTATSYGNWISTDQTLIYLDGTQTNSGTAYSNGLAGTKTYLLRTGFYSDITITSYYQNVTIDTLSNALVAGDPVLGGIRYTNGSGGHCILLNGLDWNSVSNVGTLYFVDPLNPSQNYSNSSVLGPVLQTSGSLIGASTNYLLQYEQLRGNNLTNPYPNPATNTNSVSAYLENLTILSVTPSSNTNPAWSNLVIGSNSTPVTYSVTNGTGVYSNTLIGLTTTSSNNQLIVANANTLLSNSVNLYVGHSGAGNTMVISNGGVVTGEYGVVGNYSTSSRNLVIVTGTNSLWTNAGDIAVGFDGSGNKLIISDGGAVYGGTDGVGGIIGADGLSLNNSVVVTGAGSIWSNSLDLFVGFAGQGNNMVISNGGTVINVGGTIGNYYLSSNNSVLITGAGSTWGNSSDLYVGCSGSGNAMVISNGGQVSVAGSNYGMAIGFESTSSSNSVLVTGTNADGTASYLSDAMDLFVGYAGSSNAMTIKGGGQVGSANGWIGYGNSASSNSVLVSDAGSLWHVTGDLFIGGDGSGNSLVISNGSLVSVIGSTNGVVIGLNSESSNNSVLVTGTDGNGNASTLSIATGYDLVVGCAGSSNTLTINCGALVASDNGWIGCSNTAAGNSVLVSGSGSLWTNNGDLYVGANGSANMLVIQNGGQVYVNGATNGAVIGYGSNASGNSVLVNGGSLNIGADTNGGYANADLFIGYNGKSNSLVLSNGGQVYVTGATIGTVIGYGSNSSGNQVLVSGSDSSGSASSLNVGGDKYGVFYNEDLYIGYYGGSNSLVISNGGQVGVSGAQYGTVIGFDSNSTGNSVLVTGAGSTLTNKADLTIGYAGTGTLTVASGGTVFSDSSIIIAATNGAVGTLNVGMLGGSDTAGAMVTPSIAFGSGTGTINFNQTDMFALTSSISGLGTVQQLGVGTTILSGSNSYTGSTVIAKGTLVAASTNALGGSDITLGGGTNRAVLQLATNLFLTSAPTPHNDLIWGSNGVIALTPGSQTLNLTHNMTNAGGGTFSFLNVSLNNSTNVLINFGGQSGFTTNSFSVQGIQGYSFALTSTNVSAYIAPTANIVVSTAVTLTGTTTASSFTIASGGIISGNGILNGNLTLQKGSAFVVTGSSSPMTVNGTATLGGTLEIATPMALGTKNTFLSATTVTGTFDSVLAPAGYRGRIVIEGDPTVSVIMAPASYTQMAANQNQVNVATALNSFIPYTSGDQQVVSTSLDSLIASQYNQAFNAIMPTFYQQVATIAFNEANALNMELNQRLWGLRLAEGGGFSMSGLAENYPMIQEGQGDGGKGVLDAKKRHPAPRTRQPLGTLRGWQRNLLPSQQRQHAPRLQLRERRRHHRTHLQMERQSGQRHLRWLPGNLHQERSQWLRPWNR